ncbi:MAG TPA: hypothetical protein VFX28_08500, partial [Methylomirabilota bacterium]|nr:hypothetical protein [Methylomirabilota bacterium]
STPEALASHWAARIRAALGTHKRETFSLLLAGRWIRRLIYPAAILVLLWAGLRLLDSLRERVATTPVERYPALHVLGLAAVSGAQAKGLALGGVRLARWLVGLAAVYTLLAVVFAQFPHTQAYALRMLTFVTDLLVATLEHVLEWLPPLIAGLVVLLAIRLALRLTGVLFARARRGQAGFPVTFAPDTIALSEAIVRIAIALAGVALLALVIPGEGGRAMRVALLLLLIVVAATLVPAGRQIAAGVLLAYRRAAPVGTRLEVDGVRGTVARHDLLHTIVAIEGGQEAWIPHDLLMRHRSIRAAAPPHGASNGSPPVEDDGPA